MKKKIKTPLRYTLGQQWLGNYNAADFWPTLSKEHFGFITNLYILGKMFINSPTNVLVSVHLKPTTLEHRLANTGKGALFTTTQLWNFSPVSA